MYEGERRRRRKRSRGSGPAIAEGGPVGAELLLELGEGKGRPLGGLDGEVEVLAEEGALDEALGGDVDGNGLALEKG